MNHYEEETELMWKNFERERKDSEEDFKAEMRKMEDQKRDLEETVAKYWAVINISLKNVLACSYLRSTSLNIATGN